MATEQVTYQNLNVAALAPGFPLVDHAARSRRKSRRGWSFELFLCVVGLATTGFNLLRFGGWTLSDLIFLAATAVVGTHLLMGHTGRLAPSEQRRASPVVLIGSLILLTGCTITSMWTLDPTTSMMIVVRLAWLTLVWFWLLRAVAVDHRALGRLIGGFKIAALLSAVGGTLDYLGVVSWAVENVHGRQAGFFGHPNQLGAMLVVAFPFFLFDTPTLRATNPGRTVFRRLPACGLIVFAVATTGSMTSTLGILAAVVATVVLTGVAGDRKSRLPRTYDLLKALVVAVAVGIALLALIRSGAPVLERFDLLGSEDQGVNSSVEFRGERNQFVLDRIDERIVVGAGLDDLSAGLEDANEKGSDVHNMYLKLLYEGGLPALVGLLLIQVATLQLAWRLTLHTRDSDLHPIATALLTSLIGTAVVVQFQPMMFDRYVWLPTALTAALWGLCRREQDQRLRAAPGTD